MYEDYDILFGNLQVLNLKRLQVQSMCKTLESIQKLKTM